MLKVPDIPKSWFYAGPSKSFTDAKPFGIEIDGRKFVGFRDSQGKARVYSGLCPHMGALLANGKIKAGRLLCPFHEWEFGVDGKCAHIPAQASIPDFAKIAPFPTEERHGLVFFFFGKDAEFPLPFFEDVDPNDFFCVEPIEINQKGRWDVVGTNSFDEPHLVHVHKRLTITPPVLRKLHPRGIQVKHHYRIADSTLIDRVIRIIYGERAHTWITVWAGNFILVQTDFGRFKNYLITILEPVQKTYSRSIIFVFSTGAKRGPIYRFFRRRIMRFQAAASRRFFQSEADSLEGVDVRIETLAESDSMVRDYLQFMYGDSEATHSK